MRKLSREINPLQMEQAKERTIHAVMDRIERKRPSFAVKYIARPAFFPALVLVFALIVIFSQPGIVDPNPPDDGINAYTSEKLAEISYISSSFVSTSITVANPVFQLLAVGDETEFETENDTINLYFDTLRVFLNDDFGSLVTYIELTDSEYEYLITFDVNNNPYEFYLTLDGEDITGILTINVKTFTVTGTLEESDTETRFVLEAINGSDYVHIEYKSESEDEIESTYTIQSRINNIEKEQEVKVSLEGTESKVEITDGDNEYTLKKEVEDGVTQYKLEYTINGVEGEAKIVEGVDTNGATTYSYQVKEGDVEKEIENGKPHYNYEEEDDDETGNDDPGNNPNDDEEPGNNDDTPGNQDTDTITENTLIFS